MVTFMKENGLMIKLTDKELTLMLMETHTPDNGTLTNSTAMVERFGKMVPFTKASTSRAKSAD